MRLGILCLLALSAADVRPARAQWFRPVEVTVLSRYTGFDPALAARSNTGLGARVGFAIGSSWRLEAEASNTGARQFDPSYGRPAYVPFYLRATTTRALRPRLSAIIGGGYVRNTYGSRNVDDAGVNVLAGLQLTVASRIALRLDGMLDYMPSAWTEFVNGAKHNVNRGLQLGVAVPLVEARRAPPPLPRSPVSLELPRDRDGDGVPDGADACADSPGGAVVDDGGCAPAQRDYDADGVNDARDRCPETPAGGAVDAAGCAVAAREPPGMPRAPDEPAAEFATLIVELPADAATPGALSSGASLGALDRVALDDLAQSMHEQLELRVRITGYFAEGASAAPNRRDALARAAWVRDYLVSRGVATGRLVPRASAGSAVASDRRVEVRVLQGTEAERLTRP